MPAIGGLRDSCPQASVPVLVGRVHLPSLGTLDGHKIWNVQKSATWVNGEYVGVAQ